MDWHWGDARGRRCGIRTAAHVVSLRLDNHRIVTNPMEPRGAVGIYDAAGRYTLHVSSQNIHGNRDATARALGVPGRDVRFIAPDVGGGFGAKNFTYAEHALILWAAKRVGRPVKWIATRSEGFVSDHQARDHQADASLALDADGQFLALRVSSVANIGAYMAGGAGAVQTNQYVHLQGSIYAIPAIALHVVTVLSNTTPIGVTRGPGFAEAVNIIERLIDAAARQCGFDRAELRRRNMVPAAAMPMTNALGFSVDSGDFAADLRSRAGGRRRRGLRGTPRRRARRAACCAGLGFAYHIKGTGGSPHENVDIRFEADGTVSLITGTQTIGQGHETTFPQILADRLGIPNELIRLRQGDTDLIPMGGGHGSSRATYMGGTAIWRASETIVEKGRRDRRGDAGSGGSRHRVRRWTLRGGRHQSFDLAAGRGRAGARGRHAARHLPCVDARAHDVPQRHACGGGGDRSATPAPSSLVRLTAVDDYGVLVNPMIAAGQAHGAIAQGVGQALLEHAVYDAESGQLLAGSFMDYALPRADDLPSFHLDFNGTRCTTNPLGVKGCGEAGAVAMLPAIHNAILDALAPLGVTQFDGPATPFACGGDAWRLAGLSVHRAHDRRPAIQHRQDRIRLLRRQADRHAVHAELLIALDQLDILRLAADRDVERRSDRVPPRPPSGESAESARSAASAIPR